MNKKYGINKDLTNLFFFELKDDIFLTSSTDTDYYKIIKYNNIITYILFNIITELNIGLILNLRENKKYNYLLFDKIKQNIFTDLYLRINQKDKIHLIDLPLLAYIIFYLSGILISNKIWLYNDSNIETKDKPIYMINLQKTIIHTIIDLMNTLIEANIDENKNYLYEIIYAKLSIKIKTLYNNNELIKK